MSDRKTAASHSGNPAANAGGGSSRDGRITLILADPHPMFRLGVRTLLEAEEEFEIVEVGDVDSLLAEGASVSHRAIALIDLDLPPSGGAAAVIGLRDSVATPIVWSRASRLTPDVVYELVRCGAAGVLRKEMSAVGLVRSLRAIGDGEAPLSRDLVTYLVARIHSLNAPVARRGLGALSSREREVLALVAEGHPNKVIARRLFISEFTAKRHVQNVLYKLALHSRRDAAERFREAEGMPGLIPATAQPEVR
jgi:DNA-binding NarL/FixJ family response regulator